jgi:hypothetical protein
VNKRPSPKLGDTAAALDQFVAAGRMAESPDGGPDVLPGETPFPEVAFQTPGRPSRRASSRPDGNMHGTDIDTDDMAVIREARAARERPPERTVRTTVRLPEDIATELRVVAIREGVTMAEITTGILRVWLRRYERGEV